MIQLDPIATEGLKEVAAEITNRMQSAATMIVSVDFKSDADAGQTSRAVEAQMIVHADPEFESYLATALLGIATRLAENALARKARAAAANPKPKSDSDDDDQQTTQC